MDTNCKNLLNCEKVEVNPCWQQKKLIDYCKANGVFVFAYAALGAVGTFYGTNRVMESDVLKQIAKEKGKTVAQVYLYIFLLILINTRLHAHLIFDNLYA